MGILWARTDKKIAEYQKELINTHYQEVENMYKKMRMWRHDYRNHIQLLKALADKGDYGRLREYLDELDTDLRTVDTVIKTGNPMADAILNSKISLANSKDISVQADAHIPVRLSTSELDLCCILGNLFDNAIDAVLPLPPDERIIRIYMDIQFPPFLQKGDKVVIVSPSSKIDQQFLKGAKKRIESWGLKVAMGKYAGSSSGRYAGTIRQRLKDLQDAMDDPEVKAILCSRGGYGVVHLIDKIDFTAFHEHPKWLLGFSDITALHNLFQKNGYASLHSLMARHLTVEPEDDLCTNYLKDILFGNIPSYTCEKHKLNKQGTAQGVLHGGNMAVAYGLRGTPYDIPAEGTILFIEDVSERPHAIERMMYNLKLGGVLEKLSGLIIGQFTEYEEDCSLGKELYAALADLVKEYDYPVCFNFPVGHVTHNLPLINGAKVELVVGKKNVELKFIC